MSGFPPNAPTPLPWTPPPPPPEEFAATLAESERTVTLVRTVVDRAWDSVYRGLGLMYFAMALLLFAFDLQLPLPVPAGDPVWPAYTAQFLLPAAFFVLGLEHAIDPTWLRRRQQRSQSWLRRRFRRQRIPDSLLAETIDHLRTMRREIERIREAKTGAAVMTGIIALVLVVEGVITLTSFDRTLTSGGWALVRGAALLAVGLAGAAGTIYLVVRSWRSTQETQQVAGELSRFEYRLWELQSLFWGRY